MRRFLVAVLRLVVRTFFRRVEVVGLENVPDPPRPVIFCLNHPNGLVDPAFVLCFVPRRVSFLAKAPIFDVPVIGRLCQVLEAIPVWRPDHEGDASKNAITFERARDLLSRGRGVALFPEGTTHSEPGLLRIRTGAARIALSARSRLDEVVICPVGLHYTEKHTFRSKALVVFGETLDVPAVPPTDDPPAEEVRALSDRIDGALRAVTLNADAHEALRLVERAQRIVSADEDPEVRRTLAGQVALRQRILEGWRHLRKVVPDRVGALEDRIRRYEELLEALDLPAEAVAVRASAGQVLAFLGRRVLPLLATFPLAAVGALLHAPTYLLVDRIARTWAEDDTVLSTFKLLGGALLFPVTWGVGAGVAGIVGGAWAALATLLVLPGLGFLALRFGERARRALAATKAFLLLVTRRSLLTGLVDERRAIADEIRELGRRLDRDDGDDGDGDSTARTG